MSTEPSLPYEPITGPAAVPIAALPISKRDSPPKTPLGTNTLHRSKYLNIRLLLAPANKRGTDT
jgi:hypothetical protein